MSSTFNAIVVRAPDAAPAFENVPIESLPAGDVLVDVRYSSLNYKDGLALTEPAKIIRQYPMVPGIDLSGVVLESSCADFRPGDAVVLTGWGLGETHWGGFAERVRARSEWLLPLPAGLTMKHAMVIGTAGFTAMLAVTALEQHGLKPGALPVVVTGAAGGVGSVAVAILSRLGYTVVAVTGRLEEQQYLRQAGASEIVGRDQVRALAQKPLQSPRWSGAVDCVGGDLLAALFPAITPGGSVAACGMAAGSAFHASVLPFILRGVNLLGINSVFVPREKRQEAWSRLAGLLPSSVLDGVSEVIPLADVFEWSRRIVAGRVRGRIVIAMGTGE